MTEAVTLASTLVSILLGFILLFWLYIDYRVDLARQKLFALRDSLFDAALREGIPFDAPAYGMLRSTINGSIRFSHRLSLVQLVVFVALSKRHIKHARKPFSERLEEKLRGLSRPQAQTIQDHHRQLNFLMVEHVLLSSPILLVTVLVPLVVFLAAKRLVDQALTTFAEPLEQMDDAAFELGKV